MFGHGLARKRRGDRLGDDGGAFAPTLRLYGRPLAGGLALPVIAAAYVVFTLNSAMQYWRGRGGYWKGRVPGADPGSGRV